MKGTSGRRPRYTWLGRGEAAKLGAGNKGGLLDRAARRGLAVPRGLVLLDEAWQQAQGAGLVEVGGEAVTAHDPQRLMDFLALPDFPRSVAVRSAFSAEDRKGESLAGFFTTRLNVDAHNPVQMAAALCEVWGSARRRPGSFRRDVLVMEMVDAQHAGVAFTELEFEDDLANVVEGTADTLVSGLVAGETLLLPKLRWWERRVEVQVDGGETLPVPRWAVRLQNLLRQVRGAFGAGDWDVEWADDGQRCWLVQVRPVTRPTRRNEAFTLANLKEILPDLPSPFMTSAIASTAGDLFGYYRRFDPSLPAQRPVIEVFKGRPTFNISLLTEMMRTWGLPTRLVTGNIGGHADREASFNLGRFLAKAPVLLRQGWAQWRSVPNARQTIRAMLARTEQPGESFGEAIETLRWLFATLVTEMFSVTAAMSAPLQILRSAGTLEEHNARQSTVATAIYADLEPLRALAAQQPAFLAALAQGQLPDDPAFRAAWTAYLDKHGHRGIYESDIARPRFREAPQTLLASLAQPAPPRAALPPRTWRGRLTLPVWWQASRTMRAREELRYNAVLGIERIRTRLLALAGPAVARGALPELDALWLLSIDEARRLDGHWQPEPGFFDRRRQELDDLSRYRLPDLFHRFDDLEEHRRQEGGHERKGDHRGIAPTAGRRLAGVALTSGQVQGPAWVLDEPSIVRPDGLDGADTILVARSVDAGWIPTFALVAGVVVETGGDLSHGSILLREIGLPAITNVREATRQIATGDWLLLRADAGVVEKMDR